MSRPLINLLIKIHPHSKLNHILGNAEIFSKLPYLCISVFHCCNHLVLRGEFFYCPFIGSIFHTFPKFKAVFGIKRHGLAVTKFMSKNSQKICNACNLIVIYYYCAVSAVIDSHRRTLLKRSVDHKNIIGFCKLTELNITCHLSVFFLLVFFPHSAGYLGVFADIVQNLFIYIGGAKQSERKLLVVVLFFITNKVINRYTKKFCNFPYALHISGTSTFFPLRYGLLSDSKMICKLHLRYSLCLGNL
nr:MAG TPA: hypothetical protein [Caudoviricetes sp.]